jgi:hypothetical protein
MAVRCLVEPRSHHVHQQRVEQRGHDGVRPRAAAGEFGAEEIDQGPQRRVLPDSGGHVNDRWHLIEQGMRSCPVQEVGAAEHDDRAAGHGLIPQFGERLRGGVGKRAWQAVGQGVRAAMWQEDDIPGTEAGRRSVAGAEPAGSAKHDVEPRTREWRVTHRPAAAVLRTCGMRPSGPHDGNRVG